MSDLNFDANFDEVVSFTADFGVIGSTSITVDQEVTETSSNPVASSGIYSFTTEKVGEVASAKEDKAFVCTYGTTSYADVLAAYNAGKQLILLVGVDKYYLTKVTQTNGIYAFEFSSYDSNLGLDSVRLTKTETGFSWDSDNHDSIYATKTSVNTSLATKQNTLVSGTNIKTINGQSVLGNGNLVIEGGSGGNVDDVTVNGVSVLGSDKVARVSIPTNVSSFTNDAGYITESSIPTVPTKTSDLTNDSGFITSSDIPSIPSKTSDLTNDSGFITAAYVPTKTSQLTNDSDYTTTEQVAGQLDLKQDVLTAGANITISEDNVISATGGSGGSTVTMADNAQGGVDLTVDGTSKTLAKQTSVTDLNNALLQLPQDVKINGTSILDDDKVANIPVASTTDLGTVKVNSSYGTEITSNNFITTFNARTDDIDARTNRYRPIVPYTLDYAVKRALTDGVGTAYTDTEKASACERIGAKYEGEYELVADITTESTGIINIAIAESTDVYVELSIPANASVQTGTIIFNSGSSWASQLDLVNITLPQVATASYVRKGTIRAYIRNGYWTYELTQPGGAYSSQLYVPSYSNYMIRKATTLPSCKSILFNLSTLPAGTVIKVWGVRK